MEVSVNQHMKTPPANIGILAVPNGHYKPVLYSARKATQDFDRLTQDIYEGRKNSKKLNEKKTPKSLFWVLGAILLGGLCFRKHFS